MVCVNSKCCWFTMYVHVTVLLNSTQFRAGSRFASSQREIVLLCKDVSHWLGSNLESALQFVLFGMTVTGIDWTTFLSFFLWCVCVFVCVQKCVTWGPFYWHGLTLFQAWISHYFHYKVWDEITYPFPKFNSCTSEVWEWRSNFAQQFPVLAITYPAGFKLICVSIRDPGGHCWFTIQVACHAVKSPQLFWK